MVVPLPAMPKEEKRGGTDGELIAPPALHNLKQLGAWQRPRSLTRILPKREESTKSVEDARDQLDDTMSSSSDDRDETDEDSLQFLATYSAYEDDSTFFANTNDGHNKNFRGCKMTPPPSMWGNAGSLFKKITSRSQLYKKDSHGAEVEHDVEHEAIEIILLLWTANALHVKIVDRGNQSYLKQDETQGKGKERSKSREEEPTMIISTDTCTLSSNSIAYDASGEEGDDKKGKVSSKSRVEEPTTIISTDTWTLSSNSIAEDASGEEGDDDDVGALGSFFCGMFCQEKVIHQVESSESLGPDDIPSEISYRCHHHHHAHAKHMHGVHSNDLPLSTSLVVSDVSSSSSDASDWSSECSSIESKSKERTIEPEKQVIQFVNQGRQPVKRGKWKKFLSKFYPQSGDEE